MIEGKWFPPGTGIAQALQVRRAVLEKGPDDADLMAWQAVAYFAGHAAGTGRIWWQDGAFWLGDICVLPEFRKQRLGDFLVRLLLYKAQQHSARRVMLQAPQDMMPFFEKYGFTVEGTPGQDGSITLTLEGKDILLDGCAGCKAGKDQS